MSKDKKARQSAASREGQHAAAKTNPCRTIPIMPRSKIYLIAYEGKNLHRLPLNIRGEEIRFAKLFREVWRQIPLKDRRLMLNHWRNDPGRWSAWFIMGGQQASPGIRLVDDLPSLRVACCKAPGHSVHFSAILMITGSCEWVSCVIAHELAHVLRYATGAAERAVLTWWEQYVEPQLKKAGRRGKEAYERRLRKAQTENNPEEEEVVQRIAASWGFPHVELKPRWVHGVSPTAP